MEKFDMDQIKENDSLLILGSAGEDGIIAYHIGCLWTNITLYRYGSDESRDGSVNEINHQLESRVSGPFFQKKEKKQGNVNITLVKYGTNIDITQSDKDKYDWIIKVCSVISQDPTRSGFGPYILHQKI